jgi:hypothetical protein
VRLWRHRTVVFLLVVAALAAGWHAFLTVTAPRRLAPEVAAALAREPRLNVAVRLGFAPEEFHIRLFQEYGVVRGVQGTTVLLDRVRAEDVGRLARYYWVRGIALQR